MRVPLLIVMVIIAVLRLAGIICGLWYGPWLYAVVVLGGLYLLLDFLVLYFVFASEPGMPPTENERVFKLIWVVCNLVAVLVLAGCLVLMVVEIGFWGMTFEEVHIVLFTVVLALLPLLVVAALMHIASVRNAPAAAPYQGANYKGLEY